MDVYPQHLLQIAAHSQHYIIENDDCSQKEVTDTLQMTTHSIVLSTKRMQKAGLLKKGRRGQSALQCAMRRKAIEVATPLVMAKIIDIGINGDVDYLYIINRHSIYYKGGRHYDHHGVLLTFFSEQSVPNLHP